jgi:hypothetical protein
MNHRLRSIAAMALSLLICGFTVAADGDRTPADKPAADKPAGERRERPAGDRPEPGPRFGGRGFGFIPGGLGETFAMLAELNMSPDFTLTKEQKAKIRTIREEWMKESEKWRTEHDADLKKFQAQMSEIRGNREENRDMFKFQELMKAQRELFSTAPKGEEQGKAIKALLDPEQFKQFEEKMSHRQGERRPGAPGGERTPAPREAK